MDPAPHSGDFSRLVWPNAREALEQLALLQSTDFNPAARKSFQTREIEIGSEIGPFKVTGFLGRGGFSSVYRAETNNFSFVKKDLALSFGAEYGGAALVPRYYEVTKDRSPNWISRDEEPADAIRVGQEELLFINPDSADVDHIMMDKAAKLKFWEKIDQNNMAQMVRTANDPIMDVNNRPVLVTEFCNGQTLTDRIRKLEFIRLNWFLAITRTLIEGEYNGLYHGDLKPDNIIVNSTDTVRMIDPGGKIAGKDIIVTTPAYNPFVLANSKADVMAIGIMLYQIMTGMNPFCCKRWKFAGTAQDPEIDSLERSLHLSFTPVNELNPNGPKELCAIVNHCILDPNYGLRELESEIIAFLRK